MSDLRIVLSGISFSWPDDTLVFDQLSATFPAGRTGLVAPNGAGKSTLLKLIAGQLTPAAGSVTADGVLGYLPQDLPLTADRTVAEVLGIDAILKAITAVEGGDAAEEHFTAIGADWDIEDRTRAQLDRLGLGDLALDRLLGTLSGGQVVSLGLAAQLLRSPDVLLLDEPTNNLDHAARQQLYDLLSDWSGCLLVVSHDRALLDRMDRIAELGAGEIRFYGGNFTEYEQAVRAEREVAEKNIRNAEHEVKREKREMQQARERADKRASNAKRTLSSAGLPKIFAGTMKRNAQESAAKADGTHSARVSAAKAKLDQAERSLREDQKISLELPKTAVPAGRTLFDGKHLRVRGLFAGEGADLSVRGPERIALTGPNGAGKSTLLRLTHGGLAPDAGEISRVDGRIAYLSQRLDLLDAERTVAENLADAAPEMLPADRMNLLARFLFRGARAHLPVGVLSGGERLRATLACVLFAEPAPQLLLLDEPTNNLDLVSAGQLESALNAYQGAFVVVSHDERFLAEIGVDRWLRLENGQLRETAGSTE
ncbi:ABC-F family ATP-binding cassette domain-containing protein [Amycolatopsis rubida]|uniref:ABC-F family ATP-binding cassette domain-containing protein n=1 Tax=Amycolatopsis rubida TaxID=112413 RepID=A0ABX0C922_9PSEU|nr:MULTISPECIES: ABC-F family ATP-binding cassette domain-containing protein [Amycolatopsis]MYW96511.1 ATP-binding cassette domain-containing protein [Amycolatopsis rubida]NEC61496.1 ABC-F family ATP-binding cassette domain-containing protein [Amycolatopsis rubida]OAP25871.1 ABC transporter ATP-binding protein uup [Amycolatopsis sp. M39]